MPDPLAVLIGLALGNVIVLRAPGGEPSPSAADAVTATATLALRSALAFLLAAGASAALDAGLAPVAGTAAIRLFVVAGCAALADGLLSRIPLFARVDGVVPAARWLSATTAAFLVALLDALDADPVGNVIVVAVGLAAAHAALLIVLQAASIRVDSPDVPRPVRGAPLVIATAALALLALRGVPGL